MIYGNGYNYVSGNLLSISFFIIVSKETSWCNFLMFSFFVMLQDLSEVYYAYMVHNFIKLWFKIVHVLFQINFVYFCDGCMLFNSELNPLLNHTFVNRGNGCTSFCI